MAAASRRDSPIKGAIRNNIRHLRFHAKEMTQQELADLIGATRQTVHAIEAAKYSPSLELAFRIAIAFDTSIEAVFRFEQDD